jgi:lipoprotein YgeR
VGAFFGTLSAPPCHSLPLVSAQFALSASLISRLRRLASVGILLLLAACASTPPAPEGFYRVQRGDTLTRIARDNGQTVRALMNMNGIKDPNAIDVGQLIRVRSGATASTSSGGSATGSKPQTTQPPVRTPRPTTTPARSISLAWPAEGKLARGFNGSSHNGLTIANTAGTPVTAAAAGTVAYSGSGLRGYGNMIIVRHDGQYLSIYAHNRKLLVSEGQKVTRGQRIAEMGNSDSSLVGLYFELRYDGKSVDPTRYLPKR